MIEIRENQYRIVGDVTLDTVPGLLLELKSLIASGVDTLDCSGIKNVDSSALGLLLTCKREARARQKSLSLSGIPPSLSSLAALYGITDQL